MSTKQLQDELDKLHQASWSPSVEVHISMSYTKILDIDTINQRFQAEAIIESSWHDPTIKTVDGFDDKKIWKPDIYVENGIKDIKEEVQYRVLEVVVPKANDRVKKWIDESSNSLNRQNSVDSKESMDLAPKMPETKFMVFEIRKVTGIFYENLELQDFPLDVQDLTITVTSKKPGNTVKFRTDQGKLEKGIKICNTLDSSMWHMHNVLLTREEKIVRQFSYGERFYPAIKLSCKVFRQPGFFYWNALLPIVLVTLASLAPFVVDIKIPQSRLPATCTLMLTSVGIRWTIGRLLPTVSYLTSLDKYSLFTMLIITMELLYHAIMGAIFPKLEPIKPGLAYSLDKGAFLFFCTLILLEQILFISWVIKVSMFRKEVRKNKKVGLNEELAASSVSEETSLNEDGTPKRRLNILRLLRRKRQQNDDNSKSGNTSANDSDTDVEAQNKTMLNNKDKNKSKSELSVRV